MSDATALTKLLDDPQVDVVYMVPCAGWRKACWAMIGTPFCLKLLRADAEMASDILGCQPAPSAIDFQMSWVGYPEAASPVKCRRPGAAGRMSNSSAYILNRRLIENIGRRA